MATRNRRQKPQPDPEGPEYLVSQTGIGEMIDYGNGIVSFRSRFQTGTHVSVVSPDKTIASMIVFERMELWYASATVFATQGNPCLKNFEVGPFPTQKDAEGYIGNKVGEYAVEQFREDEGGD